MEDVINISISASLEELKNVRDDLTLFFERYHPDEDHLFTLLLMVDEVVTNVIKYGYDGKRGEVLVVAAYRNGVAEVSVEDKARSFNPLLYPAVDMEEHLERGETHGLGIHVLRRFSDECTYEEVPGGNRLRIRKRLVS